MRIVQITIVFVFCAFVLGCQSEPQRYRKEKLDSMESLSPQLGLYLQNLQQLHYIGTAEIRMRPPSGKLYIDGGEYVGDEKEIALPIGAYEFRAVWNDGREVTRKIFVEAAFGEGEVNLNWNETDGKLNWNIDNDMVITKTPVELVRP